ncbi:anthranilate synthase component I [Caldithrix abyssi]
MNRNIKQAEVDYYCQKADFEEVAKSAGKGHRIPVYQILHADFLTPTMVYVRLRQKSPFSFLLESVIKGEQMGRYSFIGAQPTDFLIKNDSSIFQKDGPFFEKLNQRLTQKPAVHLPGLPRFSGGAVGYIGYDMIRQIENIPSPAADAIPIPDAILGFFDELIAFDHVKNQVFLIRLIDPENGDLKILFEQAMQRLEALKEMVVANHSFSLQPFNVKDYRIRSNFQPANFKKAVHKAVEHIYAGDIFQVVLSQRFALDFTGDVFQVYRALRTINPSPYMFFMDFKDFQLLGASPEPLIRLEDGELEIIPIAGTRPRGASEEEDGLLADELLQDPKERAEHIMLVDLARNDLGRVSKPGTVRVEDLLTIERYSHVMHIISHVFGRVKPGATAVDAFKAAFPAGTVSGAPKIRAMELINELEPTKRGFYAGAVGYFDYGGNMDTCIAIRTLLAKNGTLYWQAGAGIVADSIPENEYQETLNKGKALFKAIQKAAGGN